MNPPPTRVFLYRRHSPTSAFAVIGVAVGLAVLLSDPGWRLLALLMTVGPLWWLIDEALRRRRAVRLTETHVVVEQAIPLFTRAVPYSKIAGLLKGGKKQAALSYRRPRQVTGARPRLNLVTFAPVEEAEIFWEALVARLPGPLTFSEAEVRRFARGRRIRRALLTLAALLTTPFVVIIASRAAGLLR